MSLRRSQPASVKDTVTIDFKEGFFQNVKPAVESASAMESLKNEIAELRSQLKPPEVPVQAKAEEPMPRGHHPRSHRPSSRHSSHHKEDRCREHDHMANKVMQQIQDLESKFKKPDVSNVDVLAKLDRLETKLKPDSSVMAKLDHLETKLKPDVHVMSKLDRLETKLQSTGVPEAVMAKLDRLESKLNASGTENVMSKLATLETRLSKPDTQSAVMDKLAALEAKLSKPDTQSVVMDKLATLESKLSKPDTQSAVMDKLTALEAKLSKPDTQSIVMDKLATLESKLSKPDTQSVVMDKLATLESKLSQPSDTPHTSVLAKLDAIERKLQTDGKYQTAMSQIDGLKTHMQSEQSAKEAVFEKLAKLEQQVKVRSSMPVVTLEEYNKEQARLRKLEAMRSKLM